MTTAKTFIFGGHTFEASDCIEGVLIDPVLPNNFNYCEDEDRPASHDVWRGRPYIVSAGDTYQVYCLDGGCHDRATGWGFGLASIGEALAVTIERATPQGLAADKTKEKKTMTTLTAQQVFDRAFQPGRAPRSEAYKQGVIDCLRVRIDGAQRMAHRYEEGTAESDAYFAGAREGCDLSPTGRPPADFDGPVMMAF